jgi:hypothetical protein
MKPPPVPSDKHTQALAALARDVQTLTEVFEDACDLYRRRSSERGAEFHRQLTSLVRHMTYMQGVIAGLRRAKDDARLQAAHADLEELKGTMRGTQRSIPRPPPLSLQAVRRSFDALRPPPSLQAVRRSIDDAVRRVPAGV